MELFKIVKAAHGTNTTCSLLLRNFRTCTKICRETGKTENKPNPFEGGALTPQELLRRHKVGLHLEDPEAAEKARREASYDQQRKEAQMAAYQAQQLTKQRNLAELQSLKQKKDKKLASQPVPKTIPELQTQAEVALGLDRKNLAKSVQANYQTSQYCLNLVKQHDWENYVCSLLLKGDVRNAAMAIRAFNVEMSKVATTMEPANFGADERVVKIKYKFWEDALHTLYTGDQVPDHPVLLELKKLIMQYDLKKHIMLKLVQARNRPFNVAFTSSQELEEYAESSVSPVFYSLLQVAQIKNLNADHTASHLGKAQGITNLIRSIYGQHGSNHLYVPQEILIKNNVSQERIIRYKGDDQGVKDCIFEMASIANAHLEKARAFSNAVPKEALRIFLPAIAVERYLERLRRADFRLNHSVLSQRDSMLPFMYKWKSVWGKY